MFFYLNATQLYRFGCKQLGDFPFSARIRRNILPKLWTFLCNSLQQVNYCFALCILWYFFSCCFMQLRSQQFTFLFLVGGSKIMMIKICVLHNVFHKSNSNNMQIKAFFSFFFSFWIKDKTEKRTLII